MSHQTAPPTSEPQATPASFARNIGHGREFKMTLMSDLLKYAAATPSLANFQELSQDALLLYSLSPNELARPEEARFLTAIHSGQAAQSSGGSHAGVAGQHER